MSRPGRIKTVSVTANIRGNFAAIFMLIQNESTFGCFAYNAKFSMPWNSVRLRLTRDRLYIDIIKASLETWLAYSRKDSASIHLKWLILFWFYFQEHVLCPCVAITGSKVSAHISYFYWIFSNAKVYKQGNNVWQKEKITHKRYYSGSIWDYNKNKNL